jgi:hypothetical protein
MDSKKWEVGDLFSDTENKTPFRMPDSCCITEVCVDANMMSKYSIIISGGMLDG